MSTNNRDRVLSGINPLAYMGVEPITPPQLTIDNRAPTVKDMVGYNIGHIWLVRGTTQVWMLVAKYNVATHIQEAHWISLTSGGLVYHTDNGDAVPHNGVLNIPGGVNLHTEAVAPGGDTVTPNLIDHPTLAGGLTITPLAVPGVVTTDITGLLNSANGLDRQVFVARAGGPAWVDLESSDGTVLITDSIDPLHPLGINLRSAGGGGGGCAGLTGDIGGTATPDGVTGFIDVIGSDVISTEITGPSELTIDIEDSAAAGDIIIGGGAGVASGWGRIYSSDLSAIITPGVDPLDPLKQAINLTVPGGVGGFGGLKDDADAIAVPDLAHTVKLAGTLPFTTTTGGSTVTISAGAPNLDGRVMISSLGGPATWRELTAGPGIAIDVGNDGAGWMRITNTGGGGILGGIQQLDCNAGIAVNPVTNIVRLEGEQATYNIDHVTHPYQNIYTSCPGAPNADLVNIKLTSTIQLPLTNAGGTAGVIMIGTSEFMHAYGIRNTFLGGSAGNLGTSTGADTVGIGKLSLASMTTASQCTAVGSYSLNSAKTSNYCTAVGYNSLHANILGHGCTAVGHSALAGCISNYSTAVGYQAAMGGLSTSSTCLGYKAGYAAVGDYLVAIGAGAASAGTITASFTTAVGYYSLTNLTNGDGNCGLGPYSLHECTLGDNNLAAGGRESVSTLGPLQNLTSGSDNVALGAGALRNMVLGSNNVAIGSSAGANLGVGAGADNNIFINNVGPAYGVDAHDMIKIGTGSASCYIAGIYNQALTGGAANHPVFVDSNGKLARGVYGSSVAMAARLNGVLTDVSGDDTQVYLGQHATVTLPSYVNQGGGVYFAGNAGNPAQYTIPIAGTYLLAFNIRLNGIQAPAAVIVPPPAAAVDPICIETTSANWAFFPTLTWNGWQAYTSCSYNVVANLAAGETVKWYIQIDYRPGPDFTAAGRYKCIGVDGVIGGLYFTHVSVTLLTSA